MGEYAFFVWPCYGAVVVLLTVLCYLSWNSKRADEKKLNELKQELQNISKQE